MIALYLVVPRDCPLYRYDMIWYDTIRYDTIRYDTIRYDTIRYDTIRYDTIRYDTILVCSTTSVCFTLFCLDYARTMMDRPDERRVAFVCLLCSCLFRVIHQIINNIKPPYSIGSHCAWMAMAMAHDLQVRGCLSKLFELDHAQHRPELDRIITIKFNKDDSGSQTCRI
jgi:hypothetical protein